MDCKELFFPSIQRVRGESALRVLKEFEANQWLDRNFLNELQWRSLKLLLERAYENVPLYRNRFQKVGLLPSDIRGPEDISKIPFLTRRYKM
jgi:phenylacetate-coenzyme A ligase PaaK-like adenylate-forming protein